MYKKLTFPVIISCLGLLVSTIVLFFGNNLIQKFQRTELVYVSEQMEMKFPDKFNIQRNKSSSDSIPNLYREVRIKNIGETPSTMLKIAIELDGSIFDIQVTCIENITSIKDSGSHVEISMARLVKDAEITCKIWLIQRPSLFSITSIDNEGINIVKKYIDKRGLSTLQFVCLIIIILIVAFLLYKLLWGPLDLRNSELREQNIGLQERHNILSTEFDEFKSRVEESEVSIDIIAKLESIIEKHGHQLD